ncbi:hypothetical protein K438DRAFT_1755373 [Mycena galopus ATCC 62051]|nr:hypothetical protein K438DRAFT_1755373 [Mycena galopus ATCC 62051]
MEPPIRKPEHAPLRAQRVQLDKLLYQVIGTPGLYARRRRELQIPIAPVLNVKRWPMSEGANITLDDMVRRFAEGGIPETVVDDAFGFAQSFAKDNGPIPKDWTAQDMEDILSYSDGYTVLPPPYFPEECDPYPVSPFLPSQHEFVNIAKFDLANWSLPELAGLRREQFSEIARKIASAPHREVQSTGMAAKHNPYIKARTAAMRALAQEQKMSAQARRHAPTVARIQGRESPHPALIGPVYGYDPFAANVSLRASESVTPIFEEPTSEAQMVNNIRRFMPETGADAFETEIL